MPWSIAQFSALTISGKPVTPSVSLTGVSSRTMLAPGAKTCDHSTSRVVSYAQPTMSPLFGSNGGTGPAGWKTFRLGGSGRPTPRSKACRSCAIVGEPNESTITIVEPRPSIPEANSGPRSYALIICDGR